MRIVYHLGAHCTDEERLIRCLLKNRDVLGQQGIVVPGPARYRNLLRNTAIQLKGQAATTETQALVLDQIMDETSANRLILSWENFLSYAPWALKGRLYPAAADRIRAFLQIFPEIEAEFHLAIRNPATYLPALYEKQKADRARGKTYAGFVEGTDIFALRWSDVVADILTHNPGVPLTVWCDEDTPLLWPDILQTVSGHAPGTVLQGADEFTASLMSAEGYQRMEAYLASHPPASPEVRRRITSAFLDKFALPDRISVEVDLPGWTEGTVTALSEAYRTDLSRIAHMSGVQFLTP